MRHCIKCDKELHKTTKGDLCQLCYRGRNNVNHQNSNNGELLGFLLDECADNNPLQVNEPIVEVINDNPLNGKNCDRSIINFLKEQMFQERERDMELTTLLRDQVSFLKEEIKHKNKIIDTLINEINVPSYCNKIKPTCSKTVDNENCVNSYYTTTVNDNDADVSTSFMQRSRDGTRNDVNNGYVENPLHHEISDISSYESFIDHSLLTESSTCENRRTNNTQLNHARNKYHQAYLDKCDKNKVRGGGDGKPVTGNDHGIWPRNTTLIVGDSIISGIMEKRLSRKDNLVKVRPFPGALIEDMYYYLVPLIKKRPDCIILHCGCNNTSRNGSQEIVDELLKLKTFILQSLPECRVVFSHPTVRNDNPQKNNILKLVCNFFNQLRADCINNGNITSDCLGKSKLHLNVKGSARLAMNYKHFIKRL